MFVLQEPGGSDLLDAINDAANNAESGGGVFAFASRGGIAAFLSTPHVQELLTQGKELHLIVGVDSITNAEALLYLADQAEAYDGLVAEAFLHSHPNSTFHPKFAWFRSENGLTLVAGSGSLTVRGLGQASVAVPPPGNWEAFSIQILEGDASIETSQTIAEWIENQRHAGVLRALDNSDVQKRAMENGRARVVRRLVPAPAPATAGEDEEQPAPVALPVDSDESIEQEVLIREIPKNRHGQADVGKSALTGFFGYEGEPMNIFLQKVSLENELGEIEQERLFVNQSRNYRLELQAIAPLVYDVAANDGRMILVATKLDHRSFRYTIVPVTSDVYPEVSGMLGGIPPVRGRARPMRERIMSVEELTAEWDAVPENLLPILLPTSDA